MAGLSPSDKKAMGLGEAPLSDAELEVALKDENIRPAGELMQKPVPGVQGKRGQAAVSAEGERSAVAEQEARQEVARGEIRATKEELKTRAGLVEDFARTGSKELYGKHYQEALALLDHINAVAKKAGLQSEVDADAELGQLRGRLDAAAKALGTPESGARRAAA